MSLEQEKIKVISETLPKRCEICHQKDQYDPTTNNCSRCSEISQATNQTSSSLNEDLDPNIYQQTTFTRVTTRRHYNYKPILLAAAVILCLVYFYPAIYVTVKSYLEGSPIPGISSVADSRETSPLVLDHQLVTDEPRELVPSYQPSVPYQAELSLSNPENNPSIVLGVGKVTVIDFDNEVLDVVTGNDDLVEIKKSPSSNKIYLIGKNPSPSGNLILESKNKLFNIYFEVKETSEVGQFTVLVKVKK